MYDIEIYEDSNGKSEVLDYLRHLQKSTSKADRIKANKIRMYMRLLQEYGVTLNEPYIKHLDNDIWELRPLRDRFLFAYWTGNKFIILSHFMKQTQKTPRSEIEKAKRLYEDYRDRSDYNE